MAEEEIFTSLNWPVSDHPWIKLRDTVPQASKYDIGRRILLKFGKGWESVGVVTDFTSWKETNNYHSGDISTDISTLAKGKIKIVDMWSIVFGDKKTAKIGLMEFAHGLHLYQQACSSTEVQKKRDLNQQMLDYSSVPPGFTLILLSPLNIGYVPVEKQDGGEESRPSLCHVCGRGDGEITCSKCKATCHAECIQPPLKSLTSKSWTCSSCAEHKSWTCQQCHKTFKTNNGYKYHVKNVCEKIGSKEADAVADSGVSKYTSFIENILEAPADRAGAGAGKSAGKGSAPKRPRPRSRNVAVRSSFDGNKSEGSAGVAIEADVVGGGGGGDGGGRGVNDVVDGEAERDGDSGGEGNVWEEDGEGDRDDDDNEGKAPAAKKRMSTKGKGECDESRASAARAGSKGISKAARAYELARTKWKSEPVYQYAATFNSTLCSAMPDAEVDALMRGLWGRGDEALAHWADKANAELASLAGTPFLSLPLLVPDTAIRVDDDKGDETFVRPFEGEVRGGHRRGEGEVNEEGKGASAGAPPAAGVDLFLNAGGPVWDIAFAPNPTPAPAAGAGAGVGVGAGAEKDRRGPGPRAANSARSAPAGTGPDPDPDPLVFDRHLAVGVSRVGWPGPGDLQRAGCDTLSGHIGLGNDVAYTLTREYTHPNLLQIWRVVQRRKGAAAPVPLRNTTMILHSVEAAAGSRSEASVALVYCVGLPRRGPVWKVSWSPHPITGSQHLGVLAAVCGDGSCIVLVLPKSTSSLCGGGDGGRLQEQERESTSEHGAGVRVRVVPEDVVCRWEIKIPGNSILSVDWHPVQRWRLACGMQDGSITLWDLNPLEQAPVPSRPGPSVGVTTEGEGGECSGAAKAMTRLRSPVHVMRDCFLDKSLPTFCAVTSIRHCPFNPQLIACGGYDGCSKVWHVANQFRPMYSRKLALGWVYDTQWDACGLGLLTGGSDCTTVYWDSMWTNSAMGSKKMRCNLYSHVSQFSGLWRVCPLKVDGHSVVVSASSDGSIRGCFVAVQGLVRDAMPALQLMRIKAVEVDASAQVLTGADKDVLVTPNTAGMEVDQVHVQSALLGEKQAEDEGDGWRGKVGSISVTLESTSLEAETNIVALPHPTLAMHAVAASCLSPEEGGTGDPVRLGGDGEVTLMAYGGEAGLLRVHTTDFKRKLIL